jgi:clathrin heavy chain
MDYITRLANYDAPEIAINAIRGELYEEAFYIYKRYEQHQKAIQVLISNIKSIGRAVEYAEKVDENDVWSRLAKAQLDLQLVKESIGILLLVNLCVESYLKANDCANYLAVIQVASRADKCEDLIKYLKNARKTIREPVIDSELIICLAKTGQLNDLEDFLATQNLAQIQDTGDYLFHIGDYEAAKILFTNVSNWARLASTLVMLEDYQSAVDCARKANVTKVWKEINAAALSNYKFELAQICAMNLIIHAEELKVTCLSNNIRRILSAFTKRKMISIG